MKQVKHWGIVLVVMLLGVSFVYIPGHDSSGLGVGVAKARQEGVETSPIGLVIPLGDDIGITLPSGRVATLQMSVTAGDVILASLLMMVLLVNVFAAGRQMMRGVK